MKFLEAKASKATIENKMVAEPAENKAVPLAPYVAVEADAVEGLPFDAEIEDMATVRPRVRPNVAALAAELGVDIESVVGTGKDGAVTIADVRQVVRGS